MWLKEFGSVNTNHSLCPGDLFPSIILELSLKCNVERKCGQQIKIKVQKVQSLDSASSSEGLFERCQSHPHHHHGTVTSINIVAWLGDRRPDLERDFSLTRTEIGIEKMSSSRIFYNEKQCKACPTQGLPKHSQLHPPERTHIQNPACGFLKASQCQLESGQRINNLPVKQGYWLHFPSPIC